MKTVRPNTFETNSSSTHTICIVAESKWKAFKNGEAMYSTEHERLFNLEELYNMFIDGDEYGDYFSNEYAKYLSEHNVEKLTIDEFKFVVLNSRVAEQCFSDDRYELNDNIQKDIANQFGGGTHLNRDVFYCIGEWFNCYGMQTFDEWKTSDEECDWYSETSTIEGVSVTAFGKYS